MVKMIDISKKIVVNREATACGKIFLKRETIRLIKKGKIKKGDPLVVAQVASINAAKGTPLLLPLCHQIPLNSIDVKFNIKSYHIEIFVTVKAKAKTGVEMEALIGVVIGLSTIWDMVKYLEKDEYGQYPKTRMTEIKILKKAKYEQAP